MTQVKSILLGFVLFRFNSRASRISSEHLLRAKASAFNSQAGITDSGVFSRTCLGRVSHVQLRCQHFKIWAVLHKKKVGMSVLP